MAIVVESPNEIFNIENAKNIKIFLSGELTNCPDWQGEIIEKLKHMPKITIYNPRRAQFPIDDPNASNEQITWEFVHLQSADLIVFWFTKGSVNPIVLYELGMWGNSRLNRPMLIGIDPEYDRADDVIMQTILAKPDAVFVNNLDSIVEGIKSYVVDRCKA